MLTPQRYSERLGLIEPDQLREAAERFELGEVLDAHSPPSGPFGQNVVLTTSEGSFVLRGNPHGLVQLTKERRVALFLHERSSLPVPWPYRICEDDATFGWTYAVLPYLPGEPGLELWPVLDDAGRTALAAESGEALARLHEAASGFAGPYDAQLDDFIEMDDFAEWCLYRLEHRLDACRAAGALSTEAELYVNEILDRCADALDEPFTPVLVHHDFTVENLNFEGTTACGVFDLSEAYLGDGEEDLVRMLRRLETDEQRGAFAGAYVARRPLRHGASDRLEIYALADRLIAWWEEHRLGLTPEDVSFVESTRPILERARRIA